MVDFHHWMRGDQRLVAVPTIPPDANRSASTNPRQILLPNRRSLCKPPNPQIEDRRSSSGSLAMLAATRRALSGGVAALLATHQPQELGFVNVAVFDEAGD